MKLVKLGPGLYVNPELVTSVRTEFVGNREVVFVDTACGRPSQIVNHCIEDVVALLAGDDGADDGWRPFEDATPTVESASEGGFTSERADSPFDCEECGSPMVLRHRHRDGNPFYGCSAYPMCRFTMSQEHAGAMAHGDHDPWAPS